MSFFLTDPASYAYSGYAGPTFHFPSHFQSSFGHCLLPAPLDVFYFDFCRRIFV
jgi:hypothetical protein